MEFSHELIMPNVDLPFKMFRFEGQDGSYVRDKHWHRSVEIFAVLQGELIFYLNDEGYFLRTGEFMLVNSNEIHSIDAPYPNRTVVLQIPLNEFEHYFTGEQFIRFSHKPNVRDENVVALAEDIYTAYVLYGQLGNVHGYQRGCHAGGTRQYRSVHDAGSRRRPE